MREILFRGKRIDNGEWVEGYFGSHSGIEAFIIDRPYISVNITFEAINFYEVDPSTVGQYTGLRDKNGKRIFEGDIVKGLFLHGLEVLSVVDFEGGAFGLRWNRGGVSVFSAFTSICNVSFEVIGNIHDNPELLEV